MMKPAQIRDMTPVERGQTLQELRRELFNLRFQAASGQLEKPSTIKRVKRDIARLLTVIREEKQ